jgi:hypothetical protein
MNLEQNATSFGVSQLPKLITVRTLDVTDKLQLPPNKGMCPPVFFLSGAELHYI